MGKPHGTESPLSDAQLEVLLEAAWGLAADVLEVTDGAFPEPLQRLEALSMAIAVTISQTSKDPDHALWLTAWIGKRVTTLLAAVLEHPELVAYRYKAH